ncbi:Putative lipase [Sparassis crispa]|uniref:Lipase n=1 Tax=Sparassis crispa TaxID=139825 RepID=A0A401GWJ9_9APHY|nr:Putative lipase [Sparassis crispa]GBE86549.1 Putative lipase [Sparassis crispa]
MSADPIHLLVLVHGMWGNPGHLSEMHRIIREHRCQPSSETGPAGERLEVLLAKTNIEEHTYDGIDWGGERVAEEIDDAVKTLEDGGKKVTRFSITGYSLGGLVARYVVGILHQRKFFESVTPVNFNTIATPHIGLPRYRTVLSSILAYLGPKLLSRTGEQFFTTDKWSAQGRPLLEVMADPDQIFYQALAIFAHVRIYANAVNDVTVPYPTAAIETEDIFVDHVRNGIKFELDEQYSPVIKSYTRRDTAVKHKSSSAPLHYRIMKKLSFPLPPALQCKFPYNVVIYAAIPIVLPVLLMLIISRLSLASRASRARVKLLEEDEKSNTKRLVHALAKMELGMESAMVELIDDSGTPSTTTSNLAISNPELGLGPPALTKEQTTASASTLHPDAVPPTPAEQQVVLTELQLRLVAWLNTLPNLKKELVFIHPVRNSHAVIISRDVKRFEFHKRGEGVLRHWADHLTI